MDLSSGFFLSYVLLWLLFGAQTLIVLGLARRVATPAATLPIGPDGQTDTSEPLRPVFEAIDATSGAAVTERDLRGPALLAFVSPGCASCESIVGEVDGFRQRHGARLLLVCRGGRGECARWAARHFPGVRSLIDPDGQVAAAFKVRNTPAAVLTDETGRVLRYGYPRSVASLTLGLRDWNVAPSEPEPVATGGLGHDHVR